MTLTAPIPIWIDTGPAPTLTANRNVLTDSGALVLLGEANGFAAAFGQLTRSKAHPAPARAVRSARDAGARPHPDRVDMRTEA